MKAPFRWPRRHFLAAIARANAAKAPAGEPKGARARELLEFIRAEVKRSGEFPTTAAMMAALGFNHASTVESALLRLLGAGFIARDVVARKGARRFFAYRLPTEQPKKREPLEMQSVDLTRPEGAPNELHAVALLGYAPDGPWRVIVSQYPAQVLASERQSYRDAVAVAVFWTSRAQCVGIENHIETTKLVALRGKQNLRAPLFLLSGDKAAVLLADAATRLTVNPFDPAAVQVDTPKHGGDIVENARPPSTQTMLRESSRAVLRGGT